MGDRIGAEAFAIPGLVVFEAMEGLSFSLPSGKTRLLHIGVRSGPTCPES